jgi:hypothetical protein
MHGGGERWPVHDGGQGRQWRRRMRKRDLVDGQARLRRLCRHRSPYCSCSGAEYGNCSDVELGSGSGAEVDVRASTAARRTEMSPICSCMP